MTLRLFPFQEEAAARLSEAIDEWIAAFADQGVRKVGLTPIPFVGHLKAVTGAGKTPILARVVGELRNAVVLWTSTSSAVVEQTYHNLRTRYSGLLPPGTQVVRERPSKGEWERLTQASSGITVWVTTVGSWNEAEAASKGGTETARLNMHRPQQDWGGDKSPWAQLCEVSRPIWIVYDESHNQTPAQLDQLVGLKPVGFLLASATPPVSERFQQFETAILTDGVMAPIIEMARVRVATRDVVEAQLLKHTIEVENFDSDADTLLDAAVTRHKLLMKCASRAGSHVTPRALYIVESSNPRRGELISRPVAIWEYLVSRGVKPHEIAVYTNTKILPDDAERVTSLADLRTNHRHIICNRALQEGWDDPEAYVEYFDDESSSYTRIAQVIGRALRQPNASHFEDDALNTAYLFIRVTNAAFDAIISGLKRELSLYALDESDPYATAAVRVRTRRDPLPPVPVKRRCLPVVKIPNYQLGEADLEEEIRKIKAQASQGWDEADLQAPGVRTRKRISLRGDAEDTRYQEIAAASTRPNGEFLRRRIQIGNRHCAHLLEPEIFTGPAYEQRGSSRSTAQRVLAERAAAVIDSFERSVQVVPVKIAGEEVWSLPAHQPTSGEMVTFRFAGHGRYDAAAFNVDERQFADALDSLGRGVWARNPVRGAGYGIQLPVKVGSSTTFYPDFLWWVGGTCYAIDPTGAHLLEEKVRGKLMSLADPQVVIATRGLVARDFSRVDQGDGWSVVRHRPGRLLLPEVFASIPDMLARLASDAA